MSKNNEIKQGEEISFTYKNHKGEISERKVIPIKTYFGSTIYHPEPQKLLVAIDLDKKKERTFAIKDISGL